MRSRILLLVPFLCSPGLALEAPLEGYEVIIPEWEVEVSPGGPNATLSGTVEQVHDELVRLNPQWDAIYLNDSLSTLERRNVFGSDSEYFCRLHLGPALFTEIKNGIRYLRGVKGQPSNDRGWGLGRDACGRVSCSWNSAIWWCNSTPWRKTLNSFGEIADGAQILVDHCTKREFEASMTLITSGQVFHRDGWSVIVREDKADC